MRNLIFVFASILMLSGCMTEKIEIQTTKEWEGHFFTKEESLQSIRGMELERGESVWIISNHTLNRVLENYKNKIERENEK